MLCLSSSHHPVLMQFLFEYVNQSPLLIFFSREEKKKKPAGIWKGERFKVSQQEVLQLRLFC